MRISCLKKTARPLSIGFKESIAKFKCNTVHRQGIYKTQNVLLNPERVSFNGNSFFYLPDFSY